MFFDNLQRDAVYEIIRHFTDASGETVPPGERLTFVRGSYFPYDHGYTLRFRERTIRVEMDSEIGKSPSLFIRMIQEAPPVTAMTVADLKPGVTYEVLDTFLDSERNWVSAGDRLTFTGRESDPQGDHTLRFTGRTIKLIKGHEAADYTHRYLRAFGDPTGEDARA